MPTSTSGDDRVSILIPAYNAASWLERSVTSVLGDESADEIIIVDDGSTDGTRELGESLAQAHDQVRFHSRPSNGGIVAARLDAARLARNEWVAPVDSDDYVDQGAISDALRNVLEFKADICVWKMYRVTYGHAAAWPDLSQINFPISGRAAARLTLGGWRIHPSGVIRRDLFIAASSAGAADTFDSDELVTRRLFLMSRSVTSCDSGYYYVDNPSSIGNTNTRTARELLAINQWLLDFSIDNDFLKSDSALALLMVRDALTAADQARTLDPSIDLTSLLTSMRAALPSLLRSDLREMVRTVRGRSCRHRMRALAV